MGFRYLFAPCLIEHRGICHSGKVVYSLLLNMISMGKEREFWERRWSSPLAEFLTGFHIILIKLLKFV